jgi:ribosome-associated translation inhibitor RaiA
MQQCQIQFQGFHPSNYTKIHFEQICNDILEEAPKGAMLNAVIRRKDHEYSTHIMINSKAGRFFGLATGHKLFPAIKKVFVQIDKQIKKWHSLTHEKNSIRHYRSIDIGSDSLVES